MSYLYHALVAAVCIAVSYAFNHHQRPAFEPKYAPEQYSAVKGNLSLRYAGDSRDVELMSMHIVLHDVTRMDRTYALRELAVRAIAPADQQTSVELYVDLSKLRLDPADPARDPRSLAQQELPVLRTGRFGARRSTLALQGDKPRQVLSGTLLFTEVTQLEAGDQPSYRAAGRLELQVAGEHGVDMVTGRVDAQLDWDPS